MGPRERVCRRLGLPSWQQPVWENLKRVGRMGEQVAGTAWRELGHQWGWGLHARV